jgi:putative flippase GtrA
MAVTDNQPLRFLFVGLVVTTIDLGVTWLILILTGTSIFSVTIGFIAGLIASYLLHATISFSAPLSPLIQIPRFLTLIAINYLETISIVLLATKQIGLPTMLGKLASLPVVAITSYLLSKHWIYSLDSSLKNVGKTVN